MGEYDFGGDSYSLDPSQFSLTGGDIAGDVLDPSLYSFGQFAGADGFAGSSGLLYDTFTGQYVTPQQAAMLDPDWGAQNQALINQSFGSGVGMNPPGGSGGTGAGAPPPPGGGGSWNLQDASKIIAAALGLGAAGMGAAGIGQSLAGGNRQGPSSTQTSSGSTTINTPAPLGPEGQYLLSQLGGPDYGGLLGMAGHGMYQNMNPQNGLMNLQAGTLQNAVNQAPQVDPALQYQLMQNAYGMAQGNLPSLTPTLQNTINNIYGTQWNNIDRYLEDYLGNVRDQMNNLGWEGNQWDVLRQGPGQAMFAPALREATRQQGLLAGQAAQTGINLAQQLPQNALNLGTGVLNQGLGANQNLQNIASAFNTPIATRSTVPLNIFQSLNQNRGSTTVGGPSTTNVNQQQPPLSLLDAFAPTAQLIGGIGGLLGGMNPVTAPRVGG